KRITRKLKLMALLMMMSGCSLVPIPLSQSEIEDQARLDSEAVTSGQEAVTGPISLYEAIARALKYNLDFHLELQAKALAVRELELSRYDMLPTFVSNLGYGDRSNFSGANSRSLLTGQESLGVSTSSERRVYTADLKLSWNILDFGVSYMRARQAADSVLIAEEAKRKVVNRIVQDVRSAYWRAVSNDRLIVQLEDLMNRVKTAIMESKEVETRKLERPLTALTYQRELIGIKRELEKLQRNLSLAKIQLAALMNLRPGDPYELEIPDRTNAVREVAFSPQMMEQMALENRSEIHELIYKKRINAKEAKVAVLNLLPGLNLDFSGNYNSNSFLFNNDWLNYGARISWNLLNVLKLPATKRNIKAKEKVLDAERLALSMAILTQVHVGIAQHEHAKREYQTAADYFDTQRKILDQIESARKADSVNEQSLIREQMNTLVAEVKYDVAFAEIENAYAGLLGSVGIDPVPYDVKNDSLESLGESLKEHFESLNKENIDISLRIDEVR
ncbi:MAG: outer membrane protein TolC, partial [Gammaproteobacteria bacterium]